MNRLLAGLAACLVQEPFDTTLGVMSLPALDGRPADLKPVGEVENNAGALHMPEWPASIGDDPGQARAVIGGNNHTDGLGHALGSQRPTCEFFV
ncbi:MAG: hypothetical protein JO216_00065 [Hyphomicrobiales bacterium]|nr:hypothetical protein [Hyphomicrobiales bacterium]